MIRDRAGRDSGRHWVAAPYLSTGAAKRLRLGKRDVLVTHFDDAAIMAGQTDPREILQYMRKRVRTRYLTQMDAAVRANTSDKFPRVVRFRRANNCALRRSILRHGRSVQRRMSRASLDYSMRIRARTSSAGPEFYEQLWGIGAGGIAAVTPPLKNCLR